MGFSVCGVMARERYRGSARERGYTTQWDKASKAYRRDNPLCVMCKAEGRIVQADVVDHIIPHQGNQQLFWDKANWQSLCHSHHNSTKQHIEKRGYDATIGTDGWPVDQNNPINAGTQRHGFSIPHYIRPSGVPVHLVCGAPGSGKSTYARKNAKPEDIIVDFDLIREELGASRYDNDPATLKRAFRRRDQLLKSLADRTKGEAWLVVMAPTKAERTAWGKALGNVTVHYIEATPAECKRRIDQDPTREGARERLHQAVDLYFRNQR